MGVAWWGTGSEEGACPEGPRSSERRRRGREPAAWGATKGACGATALWLGGVVVVFSARGCRSLDSVLKGPSRSRSQGSHSVRGARGTLVGGPYTPGDLRVPSRFHASYQCLKISRQIRRRWPLKRQLPSQGPSKGAEPAAQGHAGRRPGGSGRPGQGNEGEGLPCGEAG